MFGTKSLRSTNWPKIETTPIDTNIATIARITGIKADITDPKTNAKIIHPWEAGFYENQVKLKKYDLDAEEVRQYFEFNNVTEGLFTIYQRLFNVRLFVK